MSYAALTPNDLALPAVASGREARLSLICAFVLWTHVLDGPLRFVLGAVGLTSLLYLRDLLAVFALAETLLAWLRGQLRGAALIVLLALLSWHFVIGVLVLRSLYQPALGFKVLDTFVLGFCAGPMLVRDEARLTRVASAVLIVTSVGVILNSFVTFPWVGAEYDTAFGQVTGSRAWQTFGVQRLPGFARASYEASMMLVLAGATLLPSRRSRGFKLAVFSAGIYATYLTTTKGAATAVVALAVWGLLSKLGFRRLVLAELWALLVLCIAMPVIAVFFDNLGVRDFPWWMASFVQRLVQMWPDAYAMVEHDGAALVGRGLGGIGFPQLEARPLAEQNAGDNLAVYMFAVFGVLSVVYLLGFAVALSRRSVAARPVLYGWTLVLFSVGLTTCMLESPVMSLALGLTVGYLFMPSPDEDEDDLGGALVD